MRHLPRPIAAVLALLLTLLLTSAFADDEKDVDCLTNRVGQIFCRPPGGGIALDQIGQAVCGIGGCATDHLGMVYCAVQAGVKAKFDKKTRLTDCKGPCLLASPAYCRLPLIPPPTRSTTTTTTTTQTP